MKYYDNPYQTEYWNSLKEEKYQSQKGNFNYVKIAKIFSLLISLIIIFFILR